MSGLFPSSRGEDWLAVLLRVASVSSFPELAPASPGHALPCPRRAHRPGTALQGLWSLYKGRRGAVRWLSVLFSRLKRLFSCDSAAGSALFMATVLQCSWRRKSNHLMWVRDRDASTPLLADLAGAVLELHRPPLQPLAQPLHQQGSRCSRKG